MDNEKKVNKVTKEVKNVAKKAENAVTAIDNANLALTEMRLQFDTMAEIQKEERLEYQKMHNEAMAKKDEQHEKEIKHWKHICMALILTIALFIGGLVGTAVYLLTNFEFAYYTEQNVDSNDNSVSTINDGIHVTSE